MVEKGPLEEEARTEIVEVSGRIVTNSGALPEVLPTRPGEEPEGFEQTRGRLDERGSSGYPNAPLLA